VPTLVSRPDQVTPAWLTDVLREAGALDVGARVEGFEATSIGTGQVGANVRFVLTYDGQPGPPTVVCKFASADPDSAAAGVSTLTYETEVAFYRELAHTVHVSRPHCYFADLEHGTANVVVVLEDLAPAEQGDQIAGCTVEQAELVMDEAAKLHAPRWGDPTLADMAWLNRPPSGGTVLLLFWEGFLARYRETLAPATIAEGQRLVSAVAALQNLRPLVPTAIHGDFRLDNMLFDDSSAARPVTVVDWQTVHVGSGPQDVAYFIGNAFADVDECREHQERLVRTYHDRLLERGVKDYSFDECWLEYRRHGYASLIMAIAASMLVGRTDRGDRMFMAMADRSAQLARDVDTFGVLTG
jgi:Phosphotransferase enzyme family